MLIISSNFILRVSGHDEFFVLMIDMGLVTGGSEALNRGSLVAAWHLGIEKRSRY